MVLLMVLHQGATIAVGGVVVGLGLAFAASRTLAGLLFGVLVTDAPTYVAVAALLFAVAVGGCLIAARRAIKVDPAEMFNRLNVATALVAGTQRW